MDNENAENPEVVTAVQRDGKEKRPRERSTIEFPYSDLSRAIEIAQTIHDKAGLECEIEQLAGWLKQAPTGGTFRTRLSSARIFGLIETERGQVTLTELGRQIIDPSKGRAARAASFLAVPLYAEVYDKFKGYSLPPAAALERQIVDIGVAPKQADRARQALYRSAEQAGFLESEDGRLIKPGVREVPEERPPKAEDTKGRGNGGDEPPLDPFIQGLLSKLPPSGSVWSEPDRKLWLHTAESIFKLIYEDEPGESSKIRPQAPPAQND